MYKLRKEQKDNQMLFIIDEPNKKNCSVLEAYYEDNNKVNISSIFTIEEYRGKGYASILLNWLFNEVKIKGYNKITIDDCTDLFMQPNNIYLKHGFKYIANGQPEMIKYL